MAAWEFQTLQNIAKQNGWHQFISMQNYYNLIYSKSFTYHGVLPFFPCHISTVTNSDAGEEEREMLPYCRDTGVGLIPVSYPSHPSHLLPPKQHHLILIRSGPPSPAAPSLGLSPPDPPSVKDPTTTSRPSSAPTKPKSTTPS